MIVINQDQLTPYEGTAGDEQQEQLESYHLRTEPQGRKARLITDVTSTSLRKEERAVCQ
jgi:hypothetical protein